MLKPLVNTKNVTPRTYRLSEISRTWIKKDSVISSICENKTEKKRKTSKARPGEGKHQGGGGSGQKQQVWGAECVQVTVTQPAATASQLLLLRPLQNVETAAAPATKTTACRGDRQDKVLALPDTAGMATLYLSVSRSILVQGIDAFKYVIKYIYINNFTVNYKIY